jgi:hypothetical protein
VAVAARRPEQGKRCCEHGAEFGDRSDLGDKEEEWRSVAVGDCALGLVAPVVIPSP